MISKLYGNILIAVNILFGSLLKNLFFILLCITGMIATGMSLIIININEYDIRMIKSKCDYTKTGFVFYDDLKLDDDKKYSEEEFYDKVYGRQFRLFSELANKNIINYYGTSFDISQEDSGILQKLQKGHIGSDSELNEVVIKGIDCDLLKIFNYKITWKNKKAASGLILGHNYYDKLKSKKTVQLGDKEYNILGFFKKNEKWFESDFTPASAPELTAFQSTDYFIAFIDKNDTNIHTGNVAIEKNNNVSWREMKKQAEIIAKKNNLKIKVTTISDYASDMKKNNYKLLNKLLKYSIIIMFLALVIIVFFQIYSMIFNKRLYGILYTSGLETNQIGFIIFLQNAILIFISYIISSLALWSGTLLFSNYYYDSNGQLINSIISEIVVNNVIMEMFIVSFLLCILTTIFPLAVFSKTTPLSMIKSFNSVG